MLGMYPATAKAQPFGAVGGMEGVAEIIEIGSNVVGFAIGDWVVGGFGTWQTYSTVLASDTTKLPDCTGISKVHAATICVNPPTGTNIIF